MRSTHPASQPIRVLVIGAGPMADFAHLPALSRLRDKGDVILAVVCDIDPHRALAARHKFGFLESSGDGLASLQRTDIDAVYIFGSAQLHYEYGMIGLQAGKHLFVEKPIAPSHEDAVKLAAAAAGRGLIAVGGLNRRFFKSMEAVRERAGSAGWRYAEATFHKAEFRNRPAFGAKTFLGANGIHALDALLFMMQGLPQELTAMAGEPGADTKSAFTALMRWRDGAQGVFLCNNDAGARREEYAFHGFGETYRIDDMGIVVEKNNTITKTAFPAIGDGIVAEHEAFLQSIRSGIEPLHSIAAIAPSMFLAELIESGFSGRVQPPQTAVTAVTDAAARAISQKTILVVPSAELQPGLARLTPQYRFASIEDVRGSSGERADIVAAILGRGSSPLPPDVLDKLPRLAVVGVMALSLARHDPQSLFERGITVVNASAAYADSVAEFALGLAILGRRRAFASNSVMRSGGWGTDPGVPGFRGLLRRAGQRARPAIKVMGLEPPMLRLWRKALAPANGISRAVVTAPRDLQGAVVGLLGWGENARVFASHLQQVGARVVVYSEHARDEDIRLTGATSVSLGEALASDIVSLHRGLTKHTRYFLGEAELAKLRPGTVLINTARGGLIEPRALLARIKRGDIFACLDTLEEEPPSSSDPLRTLPNVFLTSHIAGGSRDMHAAAADEVIAKVAAFLAGEHTSSISAQRLKTMS
jgi:phosphoglycerate dehydrogenase-like enzyme/predicted dehydrogenase